MKEAPKENFRWAAHTAGLAVIKARDYELSGEIEAATLYSAWKALAAEGRALRPGDLLETLHAGDASGELRIAKYIGFEPAQWYVPEPKPETSPPAVDLSAESISHSL